MYLRGNNLVHLSRPDNPVPRYTELSPPLHTHRLYTAG